MQKTVFEDSRLKFESIEIEKKSLWIILCNHMI